MNSQLHLNTEREVSPSNGKVKVTDLLTRLHEEKKIEKKTQKKNKVLKWSCKKV